MKIIVCGGDGFCGWPTSLHLSKCGHDILILDNLSRRKIDVDLEVESLTPIFPLSKRIEAWEENTKKIIHFKKVDISKEYYKLLNVIKEFDPEVIIHFAEQRSAPFSMKSELENRYTVDNNINATNNICVAISEFNPNIHLIHLGTMGVYGYTSSGMVIPEGYLNVKIPTENNDYIDKEILYPANAGSIYHMTKTLDQLIFAYYNKNYKLRITDLHQGIVWGTETDETKLDERLINRFDYDGDYGTVLNRFIMEAAIDYPLTVHGTGGQTRGFIHINNTVKCLELSVNNPPKIGDKVLIRNQITETHRVRDLARIVSQLTGARIQHIENPRNEDAENDLVADNKCFLDLGLDPIFLKDGLLNEIFNIAKKYSKRINSFYIPCKSYWNSERRKANVK